MLNILAASQHIFIDATFEFVPKPFTQILIILAFDGASHLFIPVCFAFMSNKKKETYNDFFYHLKKHQKLNPLYITCDYEQALIGSIAENFSGSTLVGCFFHFIQANSRHLESQFG